VGAVETAFPPPAEERGGAVPGSHRASWSGTHRREMEPSRGTAESHSPKRRGGSTPPEGQQWNSPECKPESPPQLGGKEAHSGLGGLELERETQAPIPPPGNPEGAWRGGDAPFAPQLEKEPPYRRRCGRAPQPCNLLTERGLPTGLGRMGGGGRPEGMLRYPWSSPRHPSRHPVRF